MLLILFGTKDRRKVEVKGQFICPKCGVERDYEAISVREWFTLFFVPIFPTANHEGRETFVECRKCEEVYEVSVLEKSRRASDGVSQ